MRARQHELSRAALSGSRGVLDRWKEMEKLNASAIDYVKRLSIDFSFNFGPSFIARISDHPAFRIDHHSTFQSEILLMDRSSSEPLLRS
jgi:hypothetical protein